MNQLEFNKKNKSIGFTGLVANIFSGNRLLDTKDTRSVSFIENINISMYIFTISIKKVCSGLVLHIHYQHHSVKILLRKCYEIQHKCFAQVFFLTFP